MNASFFDPYFKRLVREHMLYILAFILFIALDTSIITRQITRTNELKSELETLQNQISVRSVEKDKIDTILSGYDNATVAETLDIFFPYTEDSYTIFSALETMSQRTGLYIEAFSPIPFGKLDKDFITVKVDALGTKDSLLLLLQNPFYISGRLTTLHDVTYSPKTGRTTFTLNFYTRPSFSSHTGRVRDAKSLTNMLASIMRYAQRTKVDAQEVESTEYEGKQNPFSAL